MKNQMIFTSFLKVLSSWHLLPVSSSFGLGLHTNCSRHSRYPSHNTAHLLGHGICSRHRYPKGRHKMKNVKNHDLHQNWSDHNRLQPPSFALLYLRLTAGRDPPSQTVKHHLTWDYRSVCLFSFTNTMFNSKPEAFKSFMCIIPRNSIAMDAWRHWCGIKRNDRYVFCTIQIYRWAPALCALVAGDWNGEI